MGVAYHIINNMKCVLDTDVIVAGLRSTTGASRQLLWLLAAQQLVVVASVATMLEYESVLKRPENLRAANLTSGEIDNFLDSLAGMIVPVTSYFLWRPVLRDPADEHILETAVNGQADVLVTFNIRHFRVAATRFGVEVLRPGELLQRIRK